MKCNLITTYYNEKVKERNDELLTCIRANIANKEIDRVILLCDEGTEKVINHPKLTWLFQPNRPTYNDFFKVANMYDSTIKIIANTDIYFDEMNIKLIKVALEENQCYALSRWDVQISGDYKHHASWDSQDAWILRGKIRPINGDFLLGKPGSDNRIAHEIAEAGYEVINPSRTIKSYHLHITGIRNYRRVEGEVVPKPYKLIPCTYLGERQKTDFKVEVNGETVKTPIEQPEVKLTEFSYDEQRKMADDLLKEGNISKRFLLSIVIPTMHSRRESYKKLYKKLSDQIVKYKLAGKVEIRSELDDGYAPIGWKRNKLVLECGGHYVAHLDDDDDPSEDYLYQLVSTIEANYGVDVITFNAIVTYDGSNPETMYFHHRFKQNHQEVKNGLRWRERMPCHLNAIRRECALEHSFHVINKKDAKNRRERGDNGSDVHYSLDMVRDNTLKTSAHIDKVLYYYNYKSKV